MRKHGNDGKEGFSQSLQLLPNESIGNHRLDKETPRQYDVAY